MINQIYSMCLKMEEVALMTLQKIHMEVALQFTIKLSLPRTAIKLMVRFLNLLNWIVEAMPQTF